MGSNIFYPHCLPVRNNTTLKTCVQSLYRSLWFIWWSRHICNYHALIYFLIRYEFRIAVIAALDSICWFRVCLWSVRYFLDVKCPWCDFNYELLITSFLYCLETRFIMYIIYEAHWFLPTKCIFIWEFLFLMLRGSLNLKNLMMIIIIMYFVHTQLVLLTFSYMFDISLIKLLYICFKSQLFISRETWFLNYLSFVSGILSKFYPPSTFRLSNLQAPVLEVAGSSLCWIPI